MNKIFRLLFVFSFFLLSALSGKEIIDMRGKKVTIKEPLQSVATISDGFVEGVMTHLDVIDKIKVIGSWSLKRDYKYDFTTTKGKNIV